MSASTTDLDPDADAPWFFESQSWALCAVHCVNNLLQQKIVSAHDLDAICNELAPHESLWFSSHKSWFGHYGQRWSQRICSFCFQMPTS